MTDPLPARRCAVMAVTTAQMERLLGHCVPCDTFALAPGRGAGASHGSARWRLRVEACAAPGHTPLHAVVCDDCASWLNLHTRLEANRSGSRADLCGECKRAVDATRAYRLTQL